MAARHFKATETHGTHDRDRQGTGWYVPPEGQEGSPRHLPPDEQPTRQTRLPRRMATKARPQDELEVPASPKPTTAGAAVPSTAPDEGVTGPTRPPAARQAGESTRTAGIVVAVVLVVAFCALALVVHLGLIPQQGTGSGDATGEQQASADASTEGDDTTPSQETGEQGQGATEVLALLSSLDHNGEDCSLPSEGSEVDVLGGRVLVAYTSDENAQLTIERMTSAAVAIADQLAGTYVADSSTAADGVSTVPATSTPTAIESSDGGTAFSGVEVVALGQGGYVIATMTLSPTDELEHAGDSQILLASDGYAVETTAYSYSGLAARGIAQTKGDTPTLLTGEEVRINLASTSTSAQATTSTSSQSSSSTTSSSQAGTSGSASTGTTSGTSYGSGYGYGYGTSGGSSSYGSYGDGSSYGSYDDSSSDGGYSSDTSYDSGSGTATSDVSAGTGTSSDASAGDATSSADAGGADAGDAA